MLRKALEKKIIVLLGSGGVGKTTAAAAVGMQAAMDGKNVLVMTIDPARRLRSALGIPEIGNFEALVNPAFFSEAGIPLSGEFHAMILDTKSAFDDVINRISPDEVTGRSILENRIYRYVSTALAGSREYVAAERLYDIYKRDMYDVIVVDTPPARNAVDFLEAPYRMSKFLDDSIIKLFLLPQDGTGVRYAFLRRTSDVIFRLMGVVFGREFVSELKDLIYSYRNMYGELHDRAGELASIMRSDDAAFILVTGPDGTRVDEAAFLAEKLATRGYRLYGLIVNRLNLAAEDGADITREEVEKYLDNVVPGQDVMKVKRAAERMIERYDELIAETRNDRETVGKMAPGLGTAGGVYTVPSFGAEVCDLKGLDLFRKTLFSQA